MRARTRRGLVGSVAVTAVLLFASPAAVSAHTDSDVVAVPAGGEATVTLEPTHGCDGSPTVEVAIRAPVSGAVAGEVEGWTATSTPDEDGRTVLEWKGGSLPADQEGAFPVTFTAPGAVGELLTFPAVQVCENGDELSWIDGDPASDYPAPRLLVLPAGSEPAATIDDVPPDAPGRDQLTAIVDIDNPEEEPPPTTAAPSSSTSTTAADDPDGTTTTAERDGETAAPPVNDANGDDDSSPMPVVLAAAAAIVIAGGVAWYLVKRRPTAS